MYPAGSNLMDNNMGKFLVDYTYAQLLLLPTKMSADVTSLSDLAGGLGDAFFYLPLVMRNFNFICRSQRMLVWWSLWEIGQCGCFWRYMIRRTTQESCSIGDVSYYIVPWCIFLLGSWSVLFDISSKIVHFWLQGICGENLVEVLLCLGGRVSQGIELWVQVLLVGGSWRRQPQ